MSDDNKKAIQAAEDITFDALEKAVRDEATEAANKPGAKPAPVDNKAGSFESLMRLAKQTRD